MRFICQLTIRCADFDGHSAKSKSPSVTFAKFSNERRILFRTLCLLITLPGFYGTQNSFFSVPALRPTSRNRSFKWWSMNIDKKYLLSSCDSNVELVNEKNSTVHVSQIFVHARSIRCELFSDCFRLCSS